MVERTSLSASRCVSEEPIKTIRTCYSAMSPTRWIPAEQTSALKAHLEAETFLRGIQLNRTLSTNPVWHQLAGTREQRRGFKRTMGMFSSCRCTRPRRATNTADAAFQVFAFHTWCHLCSRRVPARDAEKKTVTLIPHEIISACVCWISTNRKE